jgi:hypothetical protein
MNPDSNEEGESVEIPIQLGITEGLFMLMMACSVLPKIEDFSSFALYAGGVALQIYVNHICLRRSRKFHLFFGALFGLCSLLLVAAGLMSLWRGFSPAKPIPWSLVVAMVTMPALAYLLLLDTRMRRFRLQMPTI